MGSFPNHTPKAEDDEAAAEEEGKVVFKAPVKKSAVAEVGKKRSIGREGEEGEGGGEKKKKKKKLKKLDNKAMLSFQEDE